MNSQSPRKRADVAPRSITGFTTRSRGTSSNCNRFLAVCRGNPGQRMGLFTTLVCFSAILALSSCTTPPADWDPIEPLIPVDWKPGLQKSKAGGLLASKPNKQLRRIGIPVGWITPASMPQSPYLLPSDDQGNVPACTAYGMSGICEGLSWWATGKKTTFDALALYKKEKQIDGNNSEGSTLESAIEAATQFGWFSFKNPEGRTVSLDVYDLTSIAEIKYALHRCPAILLGLNITDAWMKPRSDGTIADSQKYVGGHCIIIDGYDDYGVWICNSWGVKYGVKGHIHLSWTQLRRQWMCAKGFLIRVN